MTQIVHRPAVFYDQERYPFGIVLGKKYPDPESQSERFDDPKNSIEDLFVARGGFVVGDVLKEVPHAVIFPRNAGSDGL